MVSMHRESALPAPAGDWLTTGTPLERATRLLALLTGFSIPLSTSFSEITTGLFMASWLLSGSLTLKWALIRRHHVALLSLALFALLGLGMTWSSASWPGAARCLLKYRELVYLPMFVVVFQNSRLRTLATRAYMIAAVVLMGLSYFEWIAGVDYGNASAPNEFVVAKDRIIHGLLMAFLVYLAAVELSAATAEAFSIGRFRVPKRWVCAAVIALAVCNIVFLVKGRTGHLLLGVLTTLFLWEHLGKRGVVIAGVLFAGVLVGSVTFLTVIRERVDQTIIQLQNQFGAERKHSPDPRLEFYENTVALIRRHPWLGTGTGSFRAEYARLVANTDDRATSDPHNEYLHLASQVGLAGPALFIALLTIQWLATKSLPTTERSIGRGIVLTIAVGSLFNSLILSVTGGLIYSYFSGLAFADLTGRREVEPTEEKGTVPFTKGVEEPEARRHDAQKRRAA
jgi:O-antigen ligase